MKKTKMRGIPDRELYKILGEFHTVLNQHAQVMNAQRTKMMEMHSRLQLLEAAAGITVVDVPEVPEGQVDEQLPPLTEAQVDFVEQLVAEAPPSA